MVHDLPLGREKYHFTNYDDVFTGAALLQALKLHAHRISPRWEKGVSPENAIHLAQNLLERNVVIDMADPGRKKFKAKSVYQCNGQQADYAILNFDKVTTFSLPFQHVDDLSSPDLRL